MAVDRAIVGEYGRLMLKKWLSIKEVVPSPYVFRLINVVEKGSPDEAIRGFLGKEILTSYRNLEYLKFKYREEPKQKLIDYIDNYVIPSKKNQIARNVWQGDFGEILAGLIVSYFFGFVVPIHKMRWKFNKDRTTFCTDMVAHNPSGPIKDVFYYEIKTRLAIRKEVVNHVSNYITVNAHNSLLRDEQIPNEGIADFLSRYYFEQGDFDAAMKYGDVVSNPGSYNRKFELVFVIEASRYIADILDALHNLPPTLKPLSVTVVLIQGLGRLIVETRKLAIDGALEYVYR